MVLKNLVYGTYPAVVHCPGRKNPENPAAWKLLQALASKVHRVVVPSGLALVTVNTKPEKLLLEQQCEAAGIKLNVLGRGRKWVNLGDKGPPITEFAKTCSEKYMLMMDAPDAVIQGDLQECIDELERVGCDAICGAEFNFWPNNPTDMRFQESKYKKPWRFLNSGLIIARREFWVDLDGTDWGNCDQGAFHHLHRTMWPRIKLDDGCRIFQNVNCSQTSVTDLSKLFSVLYARPSGTRA